MNSDLFDKEGFLTNIENWTPELAEDIATQESITLTAEHWALIELARDYYQTFDISPEMRPLVKQVKLKLGDKKGKSLYLLTLFPGSPAKLISKIAGLPKPPNCI
ncbi:Sulfurtransferase TusE [BD1-7 clade bacterium]|uniref:Sulfurtransferase n=1 Tax=BD1-7 clade bacterium TaxID=2029982 RepID=A0A5S9PXN0_9GAMM|nr:Sulfurtransferase TusE [BD1-7 clade bacterium]CAA0109134.1 Sulfurtransferase TusE [BD1-7 clade bacterium]